MNDLQHAYNKACKLEESEGESNGEIIDENADGIDTNDEFHSTKKRKIDSANDSLLDKLEKAVTNNEVMRPAINDSLASIINTIASTGLNSELNKKSTTCTCGCKQLVCICI